MAVSTEQSLANLLMLPEDSARYTAYLDGTGELYTETFSVTPNFSLTLRAPESQAEIDWILQTLAGAAKNGLPSSALSRLACHCELSVYLYYLELHSARIVPSRDEKGLVRLAFLSEAQYNIVISYVALFKKHLQDFEALFKAPEDDDISELVKLSATTS